MRDKSCNLNLAHFGAQTDVKFAMLTSDTYMLGSQQVDQNILCPPLLERGVALRVCICVKNTIICQCHPDTPSRIVPTRKYILLRG